MAVFTPVSALQARQWLLQFDLGDLQTLEGISSGIENTNYFLSTSQGHFVLTLFERLTSEQLPFYLNLMKHLAQDGVPCPAPLPNRTGVILTELNGKPASLVTRLKGAPQMAPQAVHCAQVGRLLAQMHGSALSYKASLVNQRGLAWWQWAAPQVKPFLSSHQALLLDEELAAQTAFANTDGYKSLTVCAVHADLFRDNVLFEGEQLGGAIDFYFAGTDTQAFDLAVTCNDWCIDEATGELDKPRTQAMLAGYVQAGGQLPANAVWAMMLRAGALRFWLSRLYDFFLPRPAEMVVAKDPSHFERVLIARRAGR
jgi:homoserine kinase type II